MIVNDRGFVYKPRKHTIAWKVEVDDNGFVDITDRIIDTKVTLVATDEIHSAEVVIDNSDSYYSGKFTNMNEIKIYYDFSTGTTLRFYGNIEKPDEDTNNMTMKLICRHVASKLLDITVSESYSNKTASYILKDLIDKYASDFTYNNVSTTTENVSIAWEHKPFWDCVKDLCRINSDSLYDCYVDENKDFHYFKQGSRLNTQEVVVPDNFIDLDGLGKNSVSVRNRVIVYGSRNGIPIVYTAEDSQSQSTLNRVKERIIDDSNITTLDEAKKRALGELVALKEQRLNGTIKSSLLPDIRPGDKMWVSLPMHKLNEKLRIQKIVHDLMALQTECTIEQEHKIPNIFKQRFEKEINLESLKNPYKMKYSFLLPIESYSEFESYSNIMIEDNSAKISSGKQSGNFISNSHSASNNITECVLKINGSDLGASSFYVSVDNGTSWEKVEQDNKHTIQSVGSKLKMKCVLNKNDSNPSPSVSEIGILYNT